jgi:hypothetical protein
MPLFQKKRPLATKDSALARSGFSRKLATFQAAGMLSMAAPRSM